MKRIQETKKLFYRKYPFKAACIIQGGTYIAQYGDEGVAKAKEWELRYKPNQYRKIDYDELERFKERAKQYIRADHVRVRCEGRHFNIFSLDRKTHDEIVSNLSEWLDIVTEPKTDKDLEYLLGNKAVKVLVDQYPHEIYKFKIVMKPSMKSDVRLRLKGWMSKYSKDDILVSSNSTSSWLNDTKKYAQDPFIYVSDDRVRTMVELYLGTNKSRTEEFVLRSSI